MTCHVAIVLFCLPLLVAGATESQLPTVLVVPCERRGEVPDGTTDLVDALLLERLSRRTDVAIIDPAHFDRLSQELRSAHATIAPVSVDATLKSSLTMHQVKPLLVVSLLDHASGAATGLWHEAQTSTSLPNEMDEIATRVSDIIARWSTRAANPSGQDAELTVREQEIIRAMLKDTVVRCRFEEHFSHDYRVHMGVSEARVIQALSHLGASVLTVIEEPPPPLTEGERPVTVKGRTTASIIAQAGPRSVVRAVCELQWRPPPGTKGIPTTVVATHETSADDVLDAGRRALESAGDAAVAQLARRLLAGADATEGQEDTAEEQVRP